MGAAPILVMAQLHVDHLLHPLESNAPLQSPAEVGYSKNMSMAYILPNLQLQASRRESMLREARQSILASHTTLWTRFAPSRAAP